VFERILSYPGDVIEGFESRFRLAVSDMVTYPATGVDSGDRAK